MHFKKAITLSEDKPSKCFIERCKGLADGTFEFDEAWNGIWNFDKL